jgi:lactoylglutathione lyase
MSTTGLFETHLTVADLERSTKFYADIVGLPLAHHVPERGAVFFWIGGRGKSMLGLWSIGSAPIGMRLHIAFSASLDDVLAACSRLRSSGVPPLSFFGAETDEPSVIGWMPAAAVYFEDPDGHMIEYLAMLDEPPRPEVGIVPWSQWQGTQPPLVEVVAHNGSRSELRPLFEEAEDSAAALDSYIEEGDVLVAVSGDHLLGHVQLITEGDRSEIKNLAVRSDHRGHGVGRQLVDAALDLARRRQATTVAVATASADVGNLRFYQRCGFRVRSVERDAFSAGAGYAAGTIIDGIQLVDRIWLDLDLTSGGWVPSGPNGGR